MAVETAENLDLENPWPGLMPFTEKGKNFFHGRDTEVAELARRIRCDTLTVFFGQSGLGKTSLLRAGLFPLLRNDDFLPVYIHLDFASSQTFIEQIKNALWNDVIANGVEGKPPPHGETLWAYFCQRDTEFWSPQNRLLTPVLVFDQFEEIFERERPTTSRNIFLEELAGLVEDRAPDGVRDMIESDPDQIERFDFSTENYKVVVALREDFLPDLEGLKGKMPSVMLNRMRLTKMTGTQARNVVLKSGSHLVAPGVAERILDFVAANRSAEPRERLSEADIAMLEIEPALLSVLCRELNNKRQREKRQLITADLVEGAQHEIIAHFFNRSLADVDPALKLFIEDQLVTSKGYRDSRPLANALQLPGVTREAIDLLRRRFIVDIVERFGTQWLELTHDLLIGVVRQEREARRERAERAEWYQSLVLNSQAALRADKPELAELIALAAVSAETTAPENFSPAAISAISVIAEARSRDRQKALLLGHTAEINSVAFSLDGTRIVTASADHTARLWGATTGVQLGVFRGHGSFVNSAAFSPDGSRVITASADHTARLWDAATCAQLTVLKGHVSPVNSAAFSPDGERIVTASADNTVRIWDIGSGDEITAYHHSNIVNTAAFSPDGTRIVFASSDNTARLWHPFGNEHVAVLEGHASFVASAIFSPDRGRIATASADRTGRVWSEANSGESLRLQGHTDDVTNAAFSVDCMRVVTASRDLTARIWDAETGEEMAVIMGHMGSVTGAAFSPDGMHLVTGSADHTARIWDAAIGGQLSLLKGHIGSVNHATFSSDGKFVVTASFDQTARLWEAIKGEQRVQFSGHTAEVRSAMLSPDETLVLTSSADHTARLWDSTKGNLLATLQGHSSFVNSAAFSSDGTRIVTASADRTVILWDVNDRAQRAVLRGHTNFVNSALFSADGTRIVTASADRTVILWDANDGAQQAVLRGHTSFVNNALFSADGTRILTASADHTVRIWDARTGEQLAVFAGQRRAAFSPDGKRMVTASTDQTARLWDVATGAQIAVLRGHTAPVTSVAFSRDGTRIVTAARDKTARVWEVWPFLTADTVRYTNISVLRDLTQAERSTYVLTTPGSAVLEGSSTENETTSDNSEVECGVITDRRSLETAAKKGDAFSHRDLAVRYELGDRLPQDLTKALFHYAIEAALFEAARDEPNAIKARARRGSVARAIDPTDTVRVARQVADWLSTHSTKRTP